MTESNNDFPFRKLSYEKYLAIEVMTYVDYQKVLKLMFTINKQTRNFLQQNIKAVRNGFENEGLITLDLGYGKFDDYLQLERLYH